MRPYHKIQTVFKRDPKTKHKTLLAGQYTLPEFAYLAECPWRMTEKVDGTNVRVIIKDGKVTFGGRTDKAHLPAALVNRLNERFADAADCFEDDICLYGEGYGAKIQKGGGNYRSDQDFVLFDVRAGDWWLQPESVEDVAKKLDVPVVPVVHVGPLVDMVKLCADGFRSQWGDFTAEGLVATPTTPLFARDGTRIITKLKHRDFPAA